MTEAVKTLKDWIDHSDNIVFFGGAGVSTESGIPDFRSVDGLYSQQYDYPPETILSHSFYEQHPEEFYRFYRNKMLCLDARPNAAHSHHPEHRRAPPEGRQPERPGAPRQRPAQPLHLLRQVLRRGGRPGERRRPPLYLRRDGQAGCGAV